MKIYPYDDLIKLNQALSSFKRNDIPVLDVKILVVGDKVQFLVVTDPDYPPIIEKKEEKVKPVLPSKNSGTVIEGKTKEEKKEEKKIVPQKQK